MDVKDIISIAANLSSGLDKLTTDDETIYLRYLNLVHFDLYKSTAIFNPYLDVQTITFSETDIQNGAVSLPQIPFAVTNVSYYIGNVPTVLKRKEANEILSTDPAKKQIGNPLYWYYQGKKVHIYPIKSVILTVVYVPGPVKFTINTLEAEIPYPTPYHQILIDGISYYLYQGETGLKSSDDAKIAFAKFEQGKKNLAAYLFNLSGGSIGSTYSVV